jgi:[protein-PII] uridylyltransferase
LEGSSSSVLKATPAQIAEQKDRVRTIRDEARRRFDGGATGIQVASYLSEAMDQLLRQLMDEAIAEWPAEHRAHAAESGCLIAVGGTGRGELAPYSDVDLLFLDAGGSDPWFRDAASRMTQQCWNARLDLGHSVRTVRECVQLARQDAQIATALTEARPLWGNEDLCRQLQRRFRKQVIRPRLRTFIEMCIRAREEDLQGRKPTALELQPDVKTSVGGLRDLHLIRWITFALYGEGTLETLRLRGAMPPEDVRRLRSAHEYLTRIRLKLHFAAGRAQDVLTRDEQLRLAREGGYEGTDAQSPVEQFMQEYFLHSSAIAEIRRRFVALQRRPPLWQRIIERIAAHRSDTVLLVKPTEIDVAPRNLRQVTRSVESMLRVFKAAALYQKLPSPRVLEAIKAAVPRPPGPLSETEAELFRDILGLRAMLGPLLRAMFDCRLLDYIIPDITHTRSLLQFNQYHSYTVDEHTLQCMETITSFQDDDGPVGTAYRAVQDKVSLHLAMLLHDVGKGFPEDHSQLGSRIADRIARRLYLSDDDREQVMLLVQKHLVMPDLALRRDITDEKLLVDFSREVGSPDTLRMLYVLTVADVTSVGPGVMTKWKADLLAELFDRAMLIISGKRYAYLEEERLAQIMGHVAAAIVPLDAHMDADQWQRWIDHRLSEFSAYYLTCTPPSRIAADLDIIQHLRPDQIHVTGVYEPATSTVDYRIIMADRPDSGVFHKMTGVLTAKRMEILSADINTTHGGTVVDSFRVIDTDFTGEVPQERIDEVCSTLQRVLAADAPAEPRFPANRRSDARRRGPVADLPLRVVIDNNSSDSRTIVDVFAHDRPGLLYTIARTLHELRVSVDLAKIGTHFDQVIDVFYITEVDGTKITESDRLRHIRQTLEERIDAFLKAS